MSTRSAKFLPLVCCLLAFACQNSGVDEDTVAKVGNKAFSQEDYEQFSSMIRYFPSTNPQVFPTNRKPITTMVETELLYRKAPGSVKRSVGKKTDTWEWRKTYYEAHAYMANILNRNLGFSDEAIEQYYEEHKEDSFKTVVQVPTSDSASVDSASADSEAAVATRDSVAYKPLEEVRNRVIKALFIQKYPPDTSFVQRYFPDSVPDSAVVAERWYRHMSNYLRTTDQDFFLEHVYKDFYGEEMPDSIEKLIGEGKLIEPGDLEVVTNWLPESERKRWTTEHGRKQLARWVMRWKLFGRKAVESGYAATDEVAGMLDWAWKYHVVNAYVDQDLIPRLKDDVSVDTTLCTYSYWDNIRKVEQPPDSAGLAREIGKMEDRLLAIHLDSMVYKLRKRAGVTFPKSDYRDDKFLPPDSLLTIADSLRDSGQSKEAETYYRRLAGGYPFLPEGAEALSELAKLFTERQNYREAIRNHRLYLFHVEDTNKVSYAYFMIGFIYDEHLNKPQLAEVNYKWVLKNARDGELADDAEFLMLHLAEPMVRIDDLRAEAIRQGRDVDFGDESDESASTMEGEGTGEES